MALRLVSQSTDIDDRVEAWKNSTTAALQSGSNPDEWFGNLQGIDPNEAKLSYISTFISDAYEIDLNTARASADTVLERTYGKDFDLNEVTSLMASQRAKGGTLPLPNMSDTIQGFKERSPAISQQAVTTRETAGQLRIPLQPKAEGGTLEEQGVESELQLSELQSTGFGNTFLNARAATDLSKFTSPAESQLYKDSYLATDDESLAKAQKDFINNSIQEEVDRRQDIRNWEEMRQYTEVYNDNIFGKIKKAWDIGKATTVTSFEYRVGALTANVLGFEDTADKMFDMSMALHNIGNVPELYYEAESGFDKTATILAGAAPYVGLTLIQAGVGAKFGIPLKANYAGMFMTSAGVAGNSISLDLIANGEDEDIANYRGAIGGAIIGWLELAGGGANKYLRPAKSGIIAKLGLITRVSARQGKNMLRESFIEEVPQDVVEMIFTNNVPRNKDGSIDWDTTGDRLWETAMAAMLVAGVAEVSMGSVRGVTDWSKAWDGKKQIVKGQDLANAVVEMDKLVQQSTVSNEIELVDGKLPDSAIAPVDDIRPAVEVEAVAEQNGGVVSSLSEEKQASLISLRKQFREKMTGQFNAGIDPESVIIAAKVGALYVEAGVRKFSQFTKVMLSEFGDNIRPKLKQMYNQIRETQPTPEEGDVPIEMDSAATVAEFSLDLTQAEAIEVDEPVKDVQDDDIQSAINKTATYGIQQTGEGYVVIDYDTQKEITGTLKKRNALATLKKLNSGEIVVKKDRPRDLLPTEGEISTLTTRQLLRFVFQKVSQQSRAVFLESAKQTVANTKDLAAHLNLSLKGLPITDSQREGIINKLASARTPAEQANVIASVDTLHELASRKKQVGEFKKLKKYINLRSDKRLYEGGVLPEYIAPLKTLLNSVNMLSSKARNAAKRLQTHLDNLRADYAKDWTVKYVEAMVPKKLLASLDLINSKNIDELNSQELRDLNNELKRLLFLNKLKTNLKLQRKARDLLNRMHNIVNSVNVSHGLPILTGERSEELGDDRNFIKKGWDFVAGVKVSNWDTLVHEALGGDIGAGYELLAEGIRGGRRGADSAYFSMQEILLQKAKDANITSEDLKSWSDGFSMFGNSKAANKVRKVAGIEAPRFDVSINEKNRKITMAEAMSIVMHTRANFNLNALLKQGMAVPRGKLGTPNSTELQAIIDIVESNPKAVAFMEGLAEMYVFTSVEGNKVSSEAEGVLLFNEDNYFHVERLKEGGVSGAEYARPSMFTEDGRIQGRTGSDRPVVIRDIFQVISEDIGVMSQYIGMAVPIYKIRTAINYTPIRDALRAKGKEFLVNEMDSRLEGIQDDKTANDPVGQLFTKIRAGLSRAILAQPYIALGQIASYPLILTEMEFSDVAITPVGSTVEQLMNDNWIIYRARKEGVSSIRSYGESTFGDAAKKIMGKNPRLINQTLTLMHTMDMTAVKMVGSSVMKEMSNSNLQGKALDYWRSRGIDPSSYEFGSESYWTEFNRRADFILDRTQPMFNRENKSAFTISKNPILRAFAMFRAFADQPLRITRRNYVDFVNGKISKSRLAFNMASISASLAMFQLIKASIKRTLYRDEKAFDDFLLNVATAPAGLLNFIGYPAQGIIKTMLGGDTAPSAFQLSSVPQEYISQVLGHIMDISRGISADANDRFKAGPNRGKLKSEVYYRRGMGGLTADAMKLYGLPVDAVLQIITGRKLTPGEKAKRRGR